MSVIVELSLPPDTFELGRILALEEDADLVLETMVPLGERTVPFVRLRDGDSFEESVRRHPSVEQIREVENYDDETLYALDWAASEDAFFVGLTEMNARILEATGTSQTWTFDLRFSSHDALSAFQEYCIDADIDFDVERVYQPTSADAEPEHGLTDPQRETVIRAVERGYYEIPRQTTTAALGDEFGISDQAVTERLRRAIRTLVTNTFQLDVNT